MCGTTEYMPPEIIGEKDQNDKVDIWCLGILLYELLHRRPPFEGRNIHMLQFQQKKENIYFRPGVNPQLRAIVEGCLAFQPGQRPTAEEILRYPIFDRFTETGRVERDCKEDTGAEPRIEMESNPDGKVTVMMQKAPYNKILGGGSPRLQNQNWRYAKDEAGSPIIKQTQQTIATVNNDSGSAVRRIDQSPNNQLVQNGIFKKKNVTNTEGKGIEYPRRVVKYSVSRVTPDGQKITEYRSTSQARVGPTEHSRPYLNNTNANRLMYTDSRDQRPDGATRYYKQYDNTYPRVHNPSSQQYNPFTTANVYQDATFNTKPMFYKKKANNVNAEDSIASDKYAPKTIKYSYKVDPITRYSPPKMNYDNPTSRYTYEQTIDNATGKKIIKLENIKLADKPNNEPLPLTNNKFQKARPKSVNAAIGSNNITYR